MITFYILSIFPEMFHGVLYQSILKRAQENGILQFHLVNIRDYATDKHQTTDDSPFGGGPGMLMKVEPIYRAFTAIDSGMEKEPYRIFMSPAGKPFTQERAIELAQIAQEREMVILCGRYEGIDERILEEWIDEEISIGDYVLTGGELPAMVVIDTVARMLPGVLGDEASKEDDSFYQGILGYPQYTRPREFVGRSVPEVLVSGNHAMIDKWRRKEALRRTLLRRPDLLENVRLGKADQKLLDEIRREEEMAKKIP